MTNTYSSQDWLSGVSTQQSGTTTPLLSNISYSGVGGANGLMTGANLDGTTYRYAATYDLLARLTDVTLTRSSTGATLFETQHTFDGAGNVTSETTTLPQGTDQQQFCYDDQNRLTWAGSACSRNRRSLTPVSCARSAGRSPYRTIGRSSSYLRCSGQRHSWVIWLYSSVWAWRGRWTLGIVASLHHAAKKGGKCQACSSYNASLL